jgi:hypothetical protein
MHVHTASRYKGINRWWLGEAAARLLRENDIADRHLKMPIKIYLSFLVPPIKYLKREFLTIHKEALERKNH